MSDYPPQWPAPGPVPGPPTPGYPGAAVRPDLGTARLLRRPEPRFAVAIAGAGAALTLVGVLVWSVTYLGEGLSQASGIDGGPPSSDRHLLGALLSAILAIGGYALVITRRDGPLATAGAVLGALGIPATIAFLSFDLTASSGLPFNFDAVTWVSLALWLASYFFVPGMRRRTFLVFLVATVFFEYVLYQSVKSEVGVGLRQTVNGVTPHVSGLGTVAAVGLVFGLAYYAIAFALDLRGKHGPATGLLYPAFGATLTGILASSDGLKVTGAAALGLVISLALCWYAGQFGRRLTCFAWGTGAAVSIAVIIAENADGGVAIGILLAILGIVLVVGAALAGIGLREPVDMDPAAVVRSR
jgi:hypothetical protein